MIPKKKHINNLIGAVKATNTIAALKAVRPSLTSQSTVFCQNGMGITDELKVLFRDVALEYIPKFEAAIVSWEENPFRAIHAGLPDFYFLRSARQ